MKKNLEFHLTNMAKNPGKYATLQHAIDAIRTAFQAEGVTEEDLAAMPEWLRESTSFAVGKEGGKLTVLSGLGLPTEAINGLIGKDVPDTIRQLISQSNPLVKTGIEAATGQDTYSGKAIIDQRYGGRYKNMPQFIKDLIGYKETPSVDKNGKKFTRTTVDPYKAYILNNTPILAPFMTMTKRVAEVPSDNTTLLNMISRARVYNRDIAQETEARDSELKKALYDYLLTQGYGTMYEGFAIPKELRNELLNKYKGAGK